MRRTYVGQFSRYAVDVNPQTGAAVVWDAERPDAAGLATQVHAAASKAKALAWAREQAALDEVIEVESEDAPNA